MAFFTFTTVSGSAATNNLVQTASVSTGGAVTVKLVNGLVTFFDVNGNWTSTGNALTAYAPAGIPAKVASITGATSVATDLTSFQTPGFLTATAKETTGFASVVATGSTPAQIDAFIANHIGAATGSLSGAAVTAYQYSALDSEGMFAADGATAVDATLATSAQIDTMAANVSGAIKAGAVTNLFATGSQFNAFIAGTGGAAKIAAGEAVVDAFNTVVADSSTLITNLGTYASVVDSVLNLRLNQAGLVNAYFNTVAALVDNFGIISTVATGFTDANWAKLISYRSLFAQNSITNATVSLDNFLTIPNKFAAAGVASLDLTDATTAEIAQVVANAAKVASSAITNADLTAGEFASLAGKIGTNQATVDATGATDAQVTTILNYLTKFVASGLSNLTITAAQYNGLGSTGVTNLAAATPLTSVGAVSVVSATQATMDASSYTKAMGVTGSDYADSFQMGSGTSTVQGGKGADVIVGGSGADSLSGGNAADTIIGGGGADTITGGNSILANVLTGDTSAAQGNNDKFVLNGGLNTITDLGGSQAGGDADIVVISAGVTGNATNVKSWTATSSSTNAGTFNITSRTGGSTVNLQALGGTVGAKVTGNTGVDNITGSVFADTILGGAGADVLTGYLGNNVLTGGADADRFTVATAAVDTITDLGYAGATDILIVNAGGTANGTVVANWTADGSTSNAGTANLTVAAGVTVDMTSAIGGVGYTISAAANAVASTITGSQYADTITGGAGYDSLVGGAGNDVIYGGLGNDTLKGGTGADKVYGETGDDTFGFGSYTDTGLATAAGVSTSTASLDKFFASVGDEIDLTNAVQTASGYNTLMTLQTSGVISNTVTAASVQRVEGVYDATANTFTVTTTGANAVMLSWGNLNADVVADNSIIVVGVTNVTSIADGVITV